MFFFFKQKTAYEMRISDWSSDVCSSDLLATERQLTEANAPVYGRFLAERYGRRPNIVWLNGGDTRSESRSAVWDALGTTIKAIAPRQQMTFHPIGRTEEHTSAIQTLIRHSDAG